MRRITPFIALCGLTLLLAACRSGGDQGPTPQPTATPTPISTPLPALTPTPDIGSADNPVSLVTAEDVGDMTPLIQAIEASTGFSLTFDSVRSRADAVEALCGSLNGARAVALLDALSLASAEQAGCALPLAQIVRDGDAGETVTIIASSDSGMTALNELPFADFCRTGFDDPSSWLIPVLMMQDAGMKASDLRSVTDVDDVDALIAGVADGSCDAAGVTASALASATSAQRRAIRTLGESPVVPFAVIAAAPSVPLGIRTALIDAMTGLTGSDARDALQEAFAADRLSAVDADMLDAWRSFVDAAGLPSSSGSS